MGLDLQPDAVRLVGLGQTRQGQPTLEHCGCEPLSPAWMVDGRIDDFTAVTQAVSRLLRRARPRTDRVALALPEAAVITRRITLPITLPQAPSRDALDARVRAEAEQLLPFPLQEVYLDYGVVARRAVADAGASVQPTQVCAPLSSAVDVLLVAARRERVRDLQALAEAVGLEPVAVDVATFAARRGMLHLLSRSARAQVPPQARPAAGTPPARAVLELRADRMGWWLVRGDQIVEEGERVGHPGAGPGRPGDLDPALAVVSDLAQALSRAWNVQGQSSGDGEFHHALGSGAVGLEAVWLTGEPQACAAWAEPLSRLLACPCRVANPFEGMPHRRQPPWRIVRRSRKGVEGRESESAAPETGAAWAYLQACGLALRQFQP
ncbi:type IV pilus assembly protein PilM [Hylemonella gracilis ATCC 19624]|uniref:Type IV pilus assembly protein PilM n=1 Tax=Hylemonella gracilis ATCC 19624 TaxID=887062 RepID=F3KS39_9BURK|nr:type IV pilus assembly protein PilM [Hylemonella gracilis ATCC 19624]